jgi:hypothetical protein
VLKDLSHKAWRRCFQPTRLWVRFVGRVSNGSTIIGSCPQSRLCNSWQEQVANNAAARFIAKVMTVDDEVRTHLKLCA